MEELYNRQETLDIAVPRVASVVGCGGVGSHVAIALAMSGVQTLNLYDSDELEVHNLNRLPFSVDDIGNEKVEVLSNYITKLRPDCHVVLHGHINKLNLRTLEGSYMVFITCDGLDNQILVSNWCEKHGVPEYNLGYDGDHITCTTDPMTSVWTDHETVAQEGSGYTITPSWVAPAQMVAVMGVYLALTGRQIDMAVTMEEVFKKWLK